MINKTQLLGGILRYIDDEIIPVLSTEGKWVAGTIIGVAATKYDKVYNMVVQNPILLALGITNENGTIDETIAFHALRQSAEKYGKLDISIPIIGQLSFNAKDIDKLNSYVSNSGGNKNDGRIEETNSRVTH